MKNLKTIAKGAVFSLFLLVIIGFSNHANAQTVEKYGFAYAVSRDYGVDQVYISNIVKGVEKSDIYFDDTQTDLHNQWNDYLKSVDEDYFNYTFFENGFIGSGVSDYDKVYKERIKEIGDWKGKGYKVIELNNFRYFSKKRN